MTAFRKGVVLNSRRIDNPRRCGLRTIRAPLQNRDSRLSLPEKFKSRTLPFELPFVFRGNFFIVSEMHFQKNIVIAVSLLFLAARLSAAPTNAMVEPDPHLQAGPKGGPSWGFKPAESRDPKLPNVLLMGDSILNAYRKTVVEELRGKANIDAFVKPYHQASPGLNEQLKDILTTNGPYAVIHFNIGMHGWQKGRIPDGQYVPLTRRMVQTIVDNARGAQLIWCSTTPARLKEHLDQLDPDINGTLVQHNAMAATVMAEFKIPTDDLYSLMTNHLDLGAKDGIHWTPEGAHRQGIAVANAIKPYLIAAPKH